MFIVRQSEHINEDIKRNWSSWNYGLEGFEGTEEELEQELESITDERSFWISGFDIYPDNRNEFDIRELYSNYWVVVDTFHGYGLSCNILESDSIEESINEVTSDGFKIDLGEGDMVDCSEAKVVWSDDNIHILEV